jgi:hypothetical protein
MGFLSIFKTSPPPPPPIEAHVLHDGSSIEDAYQSVYALIVSTEEFLAMYSPNMRPIQWYAVRDRLRAAQAALDILPNCALGETEDEFG